MNDFLFDTSIYNKPEESMSFLKGKKRIRYAVRNQIKFTIASLEDLIPEEHRVRDVWEFVSQLDISNFHHKIKVLDNCGGPATTDPKIMQ